MAFVKQYNQDDEEEQQGATGDAGQGVIQGQAAGSVGGAPGMAQGPGKDFTKSSFVSAKKIMDKNRGSAQADLTQPFRQQIGQAQQGLGSALDQYKQQTMSAAEQAKAMGAQAGKAATDEGAFSGIKNLLGGGVQVADFQAPKSGVDVEGAQALGTQAGAASALKKQASRQGVTNYGTARSALDAALFAQDPMARQRNKELQEQRMALGQQTDEAQKTAAEQAQQARAEIQRQQEAAKGTLKGQAESLTAQGTQRAQELNQMTDQQRLDALMRDQGFKDIYQSILDQASGGSKIRSGNMRDQAVDLTGYANTRQTQAEYVDQVLRDLVGQRGAGQVFRDQLQGPAFDEQQATQFNKIQELLGSDQRAQAAQAPKTDVKLSGQFQKSLADEAAKAQAKYEKTGKEVDKAKFAVKDIESQYASGALFPPSAMMNQYKIQGGAGLGLKTDKIQADLDKAWRKGMDSYVQTQLDQAKSGKGINQMDRETAQIYQRTAGGTDKKEQAVKQHLLQKQMDQLGMLLRDGQMDQNDYKTVSQQLRKAFA